MNGQPINISTQQITGAANAGVNLLGRETTLIPGHIKSQVAVLEVVLKSIVAGKLVVVPVMPNQVESEADTGADEVSGPEDFPPRQAD